MIIVTGANGMLGSRVVQEAEKVGKVLPLGHGEMNIADGWQVFNWAQSWTEEDTVINCAGIPGDIADPWTMIQANSLGPHYLAEASRKYGFRLIHVSTDCVFSGYDHRSPRMRKEREIPNPDSFYGRTKAVGEPWGKNVTTVRTSFIGPEHGLMKWLIDQEHGAMVTGWNSAFWSGSYVTSVSKALVRDGFPNGPVHLATERPITKLEAIKILALHLGRDDLRISSSAKRIDRSLGTDYGFVLPPLAYALGELDARV